MDKIAELLDGSQAKSALWELAQQGARRMIQTALLLEQQEFLEQYGHLLTEDGSKRFVKNGYLPEREISMPAGKIPVKAPRIRDRANGSDHIKFTSKILPKYLRKSRELDELIPFLYLKGISTNDFTEVMSQLLGSELSVSVNTVVRLKKVWHQEYDEWCKRDLSKKRYAYWWADGIYSKSRMDGDQNCILVIIGALEDGRKELIAVQDGYRESALSWKEIFADLRKRGLQAGPKLAIGDGALGFWQALREDYPSCREQRCWVHKTANILDKMPNSVQAQAKKMIHEIYMADTKENALKALDAFVEVYEGKYPKAAACLLKSKDESLTFYDFPEAQWVHIRTTNPIESTFATIRLRTKKTKGSCNTQETLMMIFKLAKAAEKRWRRLRGYDKLTLVMQDRKIKDGVLVDAA